MIYLEEKAQQYVIYARKSTDEQGKQETSIEDQIKHCRELADKFQLNCLPDPVIERRSAKTSGTRPLFDAMIKKIERGEIDGIIAWHPDRLARNMGDGGQIIELVDHGKIKSLCFCTQQFSKDANGMMLLGLAFVLSKQYSDKLSTDVRRGNIERHLRGEAIGRKKHGYDWTEKGQYIKGDNWDLLSEAFQLRLAGQPENQISDWLNDKGYYRQLKKGKKQKSRQDMSPQKINRIFKDPFYYGLLTLRGQEVNLPELYDFPAMISEEDYWAIQRMHRSPTRPIRIQHYLRGKVFDADIEGLEYKPQVISGKANKYYRFVVDQKHLKRLSPEHRSTVHAVRANDIVESLDKIIQTPKPEYTEQDYAGFIELVRVHVDQKAFDRDNERKRLRGMRTKAQNELHDIVGGFLKDGRHYDETEKKAYLKAKRALEAEITRLSDELAKLEKEEANLLPTFGKLLNTMKSLAQRYKTMSGEDKLAIADLLVLNTYVKAGKVQKIKLIEPFDELYSIESHLAGGQGFEPR